MRRVFIDVNVPMYAGGTPHPLREPCRQVILAIAEGRIDAVTDSEVMQEILYRYLHIGEREKGYAVFDNFHQLMTRRILPIDELDVHLARRLAEQYPALSPRDLIHLAVMIRYELPEIISADTGFDAVTQVRRIDPLKDLEDLYLWHN